VLSTYTCHWKHAEQVYRALEQQVQLPMVLAGSLEALLRLPQLRNHIGQLCLSLKLKFSTIVLNQTSAKELINANSKVMQICGLNHSLK